eukprot:CAMPEP_0116050628 /NCGR_PEP_ID=MMETSP0322-20121206/498_1 /TAXON_ID=163516 /ORGANISM="Leptocylindrus danicus var. apora, Strain B651" /LENGTH=370 /DNA_ID=CAMNT_0003533223 /DNA_START=114 /DNA_END=1227 /DNA_ORIENTATION=-
MIIRTRYLLRGRFSSMLDMGGMPSGGNLSKNILVDTGKNNKLRAVVLDFELISRNIQDHRQQHQNLDENKNTKNLGGVSSSEKKSDASEKLLGNGKIGPDVSMVQSIAKVLNIDLPSGNGDHDLVRGGSIFNKESDDLSLLENMANSDDNSGPSHITRKKIYNSAVTDVRIKYADKLHAKLEGGLSRVDRLKEERTEALKRGDASFAAREAAVSQTVADSGPKWMATTGTGALLSYLTNRSIRICLVPRPDEDLSKASTIVEEMESLVKQLPNVRFHYLAKDLTLTEEELLQNTYESFKNEFNDLAVLVVSDKDSYLRAARKRGMYSCRVRRKNSPRGNCTTDFTVEDISNVEQVVNEINGISFNAVLAK